MHLSNWFIGVFLIALFVFQVFWASFPIFALLLLRPFSVTLFRRLENKLFELVGVPLSLVPDHVSGIKFVFYGDELPKEAEKALLIPNHLGTADGPLFCALALRNHALDRLRFVAKNSVKFAFPAGTVLWVHECVFLKRKLEKDAEHLRAQLNSFASCNSPLWLIFFAEGTYANPERLALIEASRQYAERCGKRPFKNLLFPRLSGLKIVLESGGQFRQYLDAVYDITMAFAPCPPFDVQLGVAHPPSLMQLFTRTLLADHPGAGPASIHVHINRIPVDQIPEDVEQWTYDLFERKEQNLEYFRIHQKFPGVGRLSQLSWSFIFRRLAPSLLLPISVFLLVCALLVQWKGGIEEALPTLYWVTLGFFGMVIFLMLFFFSQGKKKPSPLAKDQHHPQSKLESESRPANPTSASKTWGDGERRRRPSKPLTPRNRVNS